jgi:DNA-binding transcriptional regulator GbsR (MarR family)
MLNKEEKRAIDELKSKREYFEYQPEGCNWRLSFDEEEVHTIIDVIIALIEKQQKEIEEKTTILEQLLEDVKERANNISFETEILWRKIEKAEKKIEDLIK